MREICGEFCIFQQGNVPAYRARETINLQERKTPVFISPDPLPPNITDLNPVDYKIWGQMQQRLWQVHAVHNRSSAWSMSGIVLSKASSIMQYNAVDEWHKCVHEYVWKETFLAFNLTAVMHTLFCISCLLIVWTLRKWYCVKCRRISPISVFYILQGSAATCLRCDGKYNTVFLLQISQSI